MLYINKNTLYCKEDFFRLKEYQTIDILDFRLIIFKIYNSDKYLMIILVNNIESNMNNFRKLYINEGIEYYKEFLDKEYCNEFKKEIAIFNPLILYYLKINKDKYYQILNYQSELIQKLGENEVLRNKKIKFKYLETNVKYYDRFLDKNFCDILGKITYGINHYTNDGYINWLLTNYNHIYGLNKRKLNYGTHEVKKLNKLRMFKD
ncbi:hypothetical protein [Peptacetobacter sp. AB800]|uniref:hypothetical protein n=1 Tax=Peptacetobacter sp. AB800 TaxID=3388428 RepID=UPI0039FDBE1D